MLYDLLNTRDMILNELHQHVFLKDDAITPLYLPWGSYRR
ncbi:DUF4049 domain-containing protein [Escherichia coli]|nr:DUF4049 domain-containing protein [Escherichia coli]